MFLRAYGRPGSSKKQLCLSILWNIAVKHSFTGLVSERGNKESMDGVYYSTTPVIFEIVP